MSTPDKASAKPLRPDSAAGEHPAQSEQPHDSGASPAPSDAVHDHIEEEIDEALKESFPTSDPPSFTPTARLGPPNRDPDSGGS